MTGVTPEQVLVVASEIVLRGWTQKATARDFAGRPVESFDPVAVCWCACGAVDRAAAELTGERYSGLYEQACDLLGGDQSLLRFNDLRGQTAEGVAARLRAGGCVAQPTDRPARSSSDGADPKNPVQEEG